MIAAVLDNSVLVSALIAPRGPAGVVVSHLAGGRFRTVTSGPLLQELADVLRRPRLHQRYGLDADRAQRMVDLVRFSGSLAEPRERIRACRDPNDDMVLEAAVNGHADVIVSADKDLLALHPFRGIAIVDPAAFLEMLG